MQLSFEHLKLPMELDFGADDIVTLRVQDNGMYSVRLDMMSKPSVVSLDRAYDTIWVSYGRKPGGALHLERSFVYPKELPKLLETFFDKGDVEKAMRALMSRPDSTPPQPHAGRLVFIDIDGVLLSFRSWTTSHNAPLWRSPVAQRMKHLELDQTSIGLLVRLCDLAKARLVLTSTWRKTWPHDLTALHDRLIEQGLRRDLWHHEWMVPVAAGRSKWQELATWGGWSKDAVALIIDDELPPEDVPPVISEQAVLLQADKFEGFGAYNYFDALEFFGVKDKAVKPPTGLPPDRGCQPYPTMKPTLPRSAPSMFRL
ncbi:HAD domain-containing protein [Agrobacterium rubi]|uniref:Uncharacterized protein n=1 Tax=Agrobacterium rubi TaxID=28099 RepID=A0AAE7REF1_9HYPH|nr:HAD domain-containing protein [Agrobacterium rubi]NTE90094.1 hypothetical protein [Agrobacterium rubi]NTF05949.1 hypothetical protein [Agrobacterium rubi]NTF39453.1 hypothetical protein [Agrobacterium rubi]OCJ51776.1 hypothetical protein A6U92_25585 [Agrobacterium rubi]QTG03906.1 hypothetical protein G6M88_26015 [Agrobacterium rubi]